MFCFCFWTVGPTSDDPKIDVDVWIPVLVDLLSAQTPSFSGPALQLITSLTQHRARKAWILTRHQKVPPGKLLTFSKCCLACTQVWRVVTKVDPSSWSLLHVRRGKLFPTQTYGSRPHILAIGHPSYKYHPHFSFLFFLFIVIIFSF